MGPFCYCEIFACEGSSIALVLAPALAWSHSSSYRQCSPRMHTAAAAEAGRGCEDALFAEVAARDCQTVSALFCTDGITSCCFPHHNDTGEHQQPGQPALRTEAWLFSRVGINLLHIHASGT